MYNQDSDQRGFLTPAVKWLLIANFIVFGLQFIRGPFLEYWFALWPNAHEGTLQISLWNTMALNSFRPWQVVTYAFLHSTASFSHILFNMLALWMFGKSLEMVMGTRRFTTYYFVCVIGAALTHLVYAQIAGSPLPVIGASGGVFGLLLAYGVLFPREKVILLFFPFPIEARYFVLFYGLLEILNGMSRTQGGVAHFAHLGGMLFGFVFILAWRRNLRAW